MGSDDLTSGPLRFTDGAICLNSSNGTRTIASGNSDSAVAVSFI